MAILARRSQQRADIWPGFVDALATLLMVIIFLLMVFVLAQFFLGEALTGRDQALDRLRSQVSELADLLALERNASQDLRVNVDQLSVELQSTVATRDDLSTQLQSVRLRAEAAEEKAAQMQRSLEDAFKTIVVDREKIAAQLGQLATLARNIEALTALREELRAEIAALSGNLARKDDALKEKDTALSDKDAALKKSQAVLVEEQKISESARAQLALLNQQLRALRQQLAKLSTTLEISEKLATTQKVQIANLGKRLNLALATKVQELSRYRSEFFGRLRAILGSRRGIRIVGDRFVFQSEVLFSTGSAELGEAGEEQLRQLAVSLKEISEKIPTNINWILRVDGHTDRIPIRTIRFPSNWELSTARAISVVKFLTNEGIPPTRLAATGFGEFQPLDARNDEIANRRNRRIEIKLTQR